MRSKPLAGVRVLDLTRLLPGPVATLHLADLGADVVKIEDTEAGDYARTTPEFFRMVNRNKRGLRLDLKKSRGRETFLRLAKGAEVVVESFRPGVMAKLGVGYEAVAELNPKIVYCSITGYGQDGPYASRAGHDINYIGYAGVADRIGTEEVPVIPNFQIADLLGGALTPVMGILAALLDARSSGRGRHVDIAMTDAVFAHAIFPVLESAGRGATPARGASRLDGGLPCYNLYRTRDGRFMAVGALEQKFWETLCDTLGCPELKERHLVYGAEANAVKQRLSAVFAERDQSEWAQILSGLDCCASPILTVDEAIGNEQLRARGMSFVENGLTQLAPPLKFSEFEFAVERPAPGPGEHSVEVLREAGYAEAEIESLRNAGVI